MTQVQYVSQEIVEHIPIQKQLYLTLWSRVSKPSEYFNYKYWPPYKRTTIFMHKKVQYADTLM